MRNLRKVLLIDDNELTCSLNEALIEEMQATEEVLTFTNQWDALRYIIENLGHKDVPEVSAFDLVFIDQKMAERNDFEFLKDLEAFRIDIEKLRIVILSGYLDMISRMRLENFGSRVFAYLGYPLHKEAVEALLTQA